MKEGVDQTGSLRLDGRLVDDQGQPVAGARISLDLPTHVTTDGDGRFTFTGLAACLYRLYARKDDVCLAPTLVTLREDREPVQLTMRRGMSVRLLVLDGDSPVAGARITPDDSVVVSDARGLATVRGLDAHFQHFDITADGYAPAQLSMMLAPDPGATIEATVRLVRGAALGGVVLGPDDAAIPDATVRIWSDAWGAEARSDASGVWRVDAIAPGAYQVFAVSPVYASAPSVTVDLDGESPRADLVVRLRRGAHVAGSVVDLAGSPVPRAFVVATRRDSKYPHELAARAGEDGAYAMPGLPPGTYDLFAHHEHVASYAAHVVLGDGESVRLDFAVEDAALTGVVVDSAGNPIAGADVRASTQLVRGDVTDRLGRFDLGAFPPGEYEVGVRWSDQHEQAPATTVRITAGAAPAKLVLPALATMLGRVLLDGSPLQHYRVLLTMRPQWPWMGSPTAVHDADGRFTLAGVTPGTWGLVFATAGAASHTIAGIAVDDGATIDLGDIHLMRE